MSFRERHGFLDSIYNSYMNPGTILAKDARDFAQHAGIPMEEFMGWWDDETNRRAVLLARTQCQPQQAGSQLPLSPTNTMTPGPNNTVTNTISQCTPSSSGNSSQTQDTFSSPSLPLQQQNLPIPRTNKRGRAVKLESTTTSDSLGSPESKRQKPSVELYPCPDCDKQVSAKGWSEHAKRVHFPDCVWECPKINEKSKKICGSNSKPHFRVDNFVTHLKSEHGCSNEEVSKLKKTCKFKVENFFHERCGLCDEALFSRDQSIEHIKDHFREISRRANPPKDFGASEWKDKCFSDHLSDHTIKRGVHYHVGVNESDNVSTTDQDRNDDNDPGNDNSGDSSRDSSRNQPDKTSGPEREGGGSEDSSFPSSRGSHDLQHRQHLGTWLQSLEKTPYEIERPTSSSFGLENFTLPFTSIRQLGSGGHGLVDEVSCSNSKQLFARKSVRRRRTGLYVTSQIDHLKNELAVLKELSHPHLVKLIGAYTDTQYSHIIMTPVAQQNLAEYMRSPLGSQSNDLLLQWMGCLSSALTYLHDRQIQHLDIKPQNILVQQDNILLADFGAAKSLRQELGINEKLALTPMYCAPETMQDGSQDYSSDVFSLGCVFSEMITVYYGCSLKSYETFRFKDGSKAYYLTMSGTRTWIQDFLPHNIALDLQKLLDLQNMFELQKLSKLQWRRDLSNMIIDMLAEMPKDRPETKCIYYFFTASDYCHRDSCCTVEGNTQASKIHDDKFSATSTGTPYSAKRNWDSTARSYLDSSLDSHSSSPYAMSSVSSSASSLNRTPSLSYSGSSLASFQTSDSFTMDRSSESLSPWPDLSAFPSYGKDRASPATNLMLSPGGSESSLYLNNDFGSINFPSGFIDLPPIYEYPPLPPIRLGPSRSEAFSGPMTPARSVPPPLVSCRSQFLFDTMLPPNPVDIRRCPHPECDGKGFKDLKAHMFTHQVERPIKCPIATCDYNTKGFARKYDKDRHLLTHYKGRMVCGFCPGSGTAAEKSFNRADVFKRHLTSVHAVEHTPPSCARVKSSKKIAGYSPDATGKCSTCYASFNDAQDFFEHLDDCIFRILRQEEPSEANKARHLAEVEQDSAVDETLRSDNLPIINFAHYFGSENEKAEEIDHGGNGDDTARTEVSGQAVIENTHIKTHDTVQNRQGFLYSKEDVTWSTKTRNKKRMGVPSWGYPAPLMKMKKRVLCAFDGPRLLWKDDMMCSTDYEVRLPLADGKSYVTDLDVQTLKRAEDFHNVTEEKKWPPDFRHNLSELGLESIKVDGSSCLVSQDMESSWTNHGLSSS